MDQSTTPATTGAKRQDGRPLDEQLANERERAAIVDELASARDLYATFDPDSPPWAVEPELRRLELRLIALGG